MMLSKLFIAAFLILFLSESQTSAEEIWVEFRYINAYGTTVSGDSIDVNYTLLQPQREGPTQETMGRINTNLQGNFLPVATGATLRIRVSRAGYQKWHLKIGEDRYPQGSNEYIEVGQEIAIPPRALKRESDNAPAKTVTVILSEPNYFQKDEGTWLTVFTRSPGGKIPTRGSVFVTRLSAIKGVEEKNWKGQRKGLDGQAVSFDLSGNVNQEFLVKAISPGEGQTQDTIRIARGENHLSLSLSLTGASNPEDTEYEACYIQVVDAKSGSPIKKFHIWYNVANAQLTGDYNTNSSIWAFPNLQTKLEGEYVNYGISARGYQDNQFSDILFWNGTKTITLKKNWKGRILGSTQTKIVSASIATAASIVAATYEKSRRNAEAEYKNLQYTSNSFDQAWNRVKNAETNRNISAGIAGAALVCLAISFQF